MHLFQQASRRKSHASAAAASNVESIKDPLLREKVERLSNDPRFASTVVDKYNEQRRMVEHDKQDQREKARIEKIKSSMEPALFADLSARADSYRAKTLEEAQKLDNMTPLEMYEFQLKEKRRGDFSSNLKICVFFLANVATIFFGTFWWWGFW